MQFQRILRFLYIQNKLIKPLEVLWSFNCYRISPKLAMSVVTMSVNIQTDMLAI